MADPISLDPDVLLATTRARHRQQMAAAAQREADLIEEIASLEAYCRMLQSAATPNPSTPDAASQP